MKDSKRSQEYIIIYIIVWKKDAIIEYGEKDIKIIKYDDSMEKNSDNLEKKKCDFDI